jgi:alkanesulfonate monooxygenase SsuD/methylene tetrahydromethanopterin reductase-like flavin-dependent oxidoreductase (luciferase family)
MLISAGLPTGLVRGHPERLLEWAVRADVGPFSSVAVSDRVVVEAPEPLAVLAVTAGATRRVGLLASVLISPTRETSLLARQAASIDGLSGGRLTLGLGIGARRDDYLATGTSFATRGRRFDEQLASLRSIWAAQVRPEALGPIGPRPARPGGPELLIGGYVDAVARRVAAWGDGFMAPGGGDPDRMAALMGRVREAWATAGRTGEPRFLSGTYFALGPRAEEAARAYIHGAYGYDPALAARRLASVPFTPEAVRQAMQRQADLGVDEFVLRPCSADLELLDRLADLVD